MKSPILHDLAPKVCCQMAWLAVCFAGISIVPAFGEQPFLTARGDRLFAGDQEFRFVSFNIPNLHLVEDNYGFAKTNPWRWPDRFEIEDALETIRQLGGKVVRSYVISVRRDDSDMGEHVHVLGPGDFNEEAFCVLDQVLQIAREKQIRVIVPLVDNWHWWGGVKEYSGFRGKDASEFWTEPRLIDDFQETIRYVLNRTNTLTGQRYKDDPTIFGWETGNELDSPAEWTAQIAAFIKSLDKNHLVIDGNSLHGVLDSSLNDRNVDIVTTHHYPNVNASMSQAVQSAVAKVKGKKPYFVGEFGFVPLAEVKQILTTVEEANLSGTLFWSIRPHRREGGFYWHSEGSGGNLYKAYHWPGFAAGDPYEETELLKTMRRFAYAMDGKLPPPVPVPIAPKLLPIESVGHISWQGSAGAGAYDVQRSAEADGPWQTVGPSVSDAAVQYRPLFCDTTAAVGGPCFYRVIARNESGSSEPSNVVGPVAVDCQIIVDEFTEQPPAGVERSVAGIAQWLTTDARVVQEDIHRVVPEGSAAITYRFQQPLIDLSLFAFRKDETASEPRFAVSADGESFESIDVQAEVTKLAGGDYGYWFPTSYRFQVKRPDARFVRIEFTDAPGDIQLSRLELTCQPLK